MVQEGIVVGVAVSTALAGVDLVAVGSTVGFHNRGGVDGLGAHLGADLRVIDELLVVEEILGVVLHSPVAGHVLAHQALAVGTAVRIHFKEGDLTGDAVAPDAASPGAQGVAHQHANQAAVVGVAVLRGEAVDLHGAALNIHEARGQDAAHELLVPAGLVRIRADQGHVHLAIADIAAAVARQAAHAEHPVMSPQFQGTGDGTAGDGAGLAVACQARQETGFVGLRKALNVDELQVLDFRFLQDAEETHIAGLIELAVAVAGVGLGVAGLGQLQIQQGMAVAVQGAVKINGLPGDARHIQIFHEDVAALGIFRHGGQVLRGVDGNNLLLGKYRHGQGRNQDQCPEPDGLFHMMRLVSLFST